jgi:hypothetical protein
MLGELEYSLKVGLKNPFMSTFIHIVPLEIRSKGISPWIGMISSLKGILSQVEVVLPKETNIDFLEAQLRIVSTIDKPGPKGK